MADVNSKNLEPIEEADLNLKDKFIGGVSADDKEKKYLENAKEGPQVIEMALSRKEGASEKEEAYSKILSRVSSQVQAPVADGDVKTDAREVDAGIDAENKIKNLVVLAQTKGIPHAVKVARHMEDNYALDEFHDRLLGEELRLALIEQGLIKEI